jgi:hypothetical protein
VPPVMQHVGPNALAMESETRGSATSAEHASTSSVVAGTRRAANPRPSASTATQYATSLTVAGRQAGSPALSSTSRSTVPPYTRGCSSCSPRARVTSAATVGRRLAPPDTKR